MPVLDTKPRDTEPRTIIPTADYMARVGKIYDEPNNFPGQEGKTQLVWPFIVAKPWPMSLQIEGFEMISLRGWTGTYIGLYTDQVTNQLKKTKGRIWTEAAEGRELLDDEQIDTDTLYGRWVIVSIQADYSNPDKPKNKILSLRALPTTAKIPAELLTQVAEFEAEQERKYSGKGNAGGQAHDNGNGGGKGPYQHPAAYASSKPTPAQALQEAEKEREIAKDLDFREPTQEELVGLVGRRKKALEALEKFDWWSEDDLPKHREQNIHGRPVSRFGNLAPKVQLYEVEMLEMWASGKEKPDAIF